MKFETEEDLKNSMGIDSWRNLSKDKFITFVSDLPEMSKDLAIKVVEQFPDFKGLVLDSLSRVQDQATHAVDANWKSQKKVHKAFAEYRAVLTRELDRDNLTSEDRFAILELFKKAVDDESLKDTEHKAFVQRTVAIVGTAALIVVAAGAAVLGVKGKAEI